MRYERARRRQRLIRDEAHTAAVRRPTRTAGTAGPWRGAAPELAIAAIAVLAVALAAYLTAGWMGLAVVAIAAAATAVVVTRGLLPLRLPDAYRKAPPKPAARSVTGYSHRRYVVGTATTNRGYYDTELRPVLEHLLAARLAERHGVNLYQDPAAARKVFGDQRLWAWIDPAAPRTDKNTSGRGIPRHTLARLIDRLEKL